MSVLANPLPQCLGIDFEWAKPPCSTTISGGVRLHGRMLRQINALLKKLEVWFHSLAPRGSATLLYPICDRVNWPPRKTSIKAPKLTPRPLSMLLTLISVCLALTTPLWRLTPLVGLIKRMSCWAMSEH